MCRTEKFLPPIPGNPCDGVLSGWVIGVGFASDTPSGLGWNHGDTRLFLCQEFFQQVGCRATDQESEHRIPRWFEEIRHPKTGCQFIRYPRGHGTESCVAVCGEDASRACPRSGCTRQELWGSGEGRRARATPGWHGFVHPGSRSRIRLTSLVHVAGACGRGHRGHHLDPVRNDCSTDTGGSVLRCLAGPATPQGPGRGFPQGIGLVPSHHGCARAHQSFTWTSPPGPDGGAAACRRGARFPGE